MARRVWYQRRFKRGETLDIEEGCEFICPQNMYFEGWVAFGRNSYLNAEKGFIKVGNYSGFNENAHINSSAGGEIRIGSCCQVGPNVVLRTANHRFDDLNTVICKQGHTSGDILIEDDVWVGANTVILGGVHVGRGAVIGAGSVVTRSVPDLAVVAGVPAKIIKFRGSPPEGVGARQVST